jgi:alkanesulfonate monooxygenase SsuD/methylene tetrahydromethanopterin reductase-like flavin-dependent oxidoreductase (luciferase family)
MRLGLVFQEDYSAPGALDRQLEVIRIADDLGYELVCGSETWGLSTLPWLAVIARETRNIKIGTAIINNYSRSPAAVAQEFAALDVLSGGRAVLGLGSSASAVIEQFHGMPFDKPLTRLKEYVEIFKSLVRGERLVHEGTIFHMDRGFTMDYARPRDDIPVYIAAITPKSIQQTAEIADGIIPIHWPKQHFAGLRRQLDDAGREAGREPSELTIAPHMSVWITDGENDGEQWHAAKEHLSHYMNRMGDFYWQMFQRLGYEEEVAASRGAAAQRDREGAIHAISERMVRDIDVIGPVEAAREQLQERSDLGADLQLLKKLPSDPRKAGPILEALIR